MTPTIRIAAAIIINLAGQVLLVRKHGTIAFMQPGGKIEPGETPAAALVRELREELGLIIAPETPSYLGRAQAPAANEPGHIVDAELFLVHLTQTPVPTGEIAELLWAAPTQAQSLPLAPLTRDHIFLKVNQSAINDYS